MKMFETRSVYTESIDYATKRDTVEFLRFCIIALKTIGSLTVPSLREVVHDFDWMKGWGIR